MSRPMAQAGRQGEGLCLRECLFPFKLDAGARSPKPGGPAAAAGPGEPGPGSGAGPVLQFFTRLRRHASLDGASPYFKVKKWKMEPNQRASSLDTRGEQWPWTATAWRLGTQEGVTAPEGPVVPICQSAPCHSLRWTRPGAAPCPGEARGLSAWSSPG